MTLTLVYDVYYVFIDFDDIQRSQFVSVPAFINSAFITHN